MRSIDQKDMPDYVIENVEVCRKEIMQELQKIFYRHDPTIFVNALMYAYLHSIFNLFSEDKNGAEKLNSLFSTMNYNFVTNYLDIFEEEQDDEDEED